MSLRGKPEFIRSLQILDLKVVESMMSFQRLEKQRLTCQGPQDAPSVMEHSVSLESTTQEEPYLHVQIVAKNIGKERIGRS